MKKTFTCKDVTGLLSRYQDNELDGEHHPAVEVHLEGCEACRGQLRQLELLVRKMKSVPPAEPLPNFNALVMSGIKDRRARAWLTRPSYIYSLVFVVFCLLGLLLGPQWKTAGANPGAEEIAAVTEMVENSLIAQYSNVLAESRQLTLMDVQDSTFDTLLNEEYSQ